MPTNGVMTLDRHSAYGGVNHSPCHSRGVERLVCNLDSTFRTRSTATLWGNRSSPSRLLFIKELAKDNPTLLRVATSRLQGLEARFGDRVSEPSWDKAPTRFSMFAYFCCDASEGITGRMT